MPTHKMRIFADFTGFNNLSEDKKSLINFLMENGAVYFRGKYGVDDTAEALTGMCGNLRLTTRTISQDGAFSYDLVALYGNLELVSGEDYGTITSAIINTDSTTLIAKDTNLVLYSSFNDGNNNHVEPVKAGLNHLFSTPVTLTPKIGNLVNDNPNIIPQSLVYKHADEYGNYIAKMPIDTEDMEFQYDIQLRTPTLTLEYYDPRTGEYADKNVFYKIGIVSLNSDHDVITIKENLMNFHTLNITLVGGTGQSSLEYTLESSVLETASPTSPISPLNPNNPIVASVNPNTRSVNLQSANLNSDVIQFPDHPYYFETSIDTVSGRISTAPVEVQQDLVIPPYELVARVMIFPLLQYIHDNLTLIGLLYVKLCDSATGDLFTDIIPYSYQLKIRYTEDGPVTDLGEHDYFPFIDHDLDHGFVPIQEVLTFYTIPDLESPIIPQISYQGECTLYDEAGNQINHNDVLDNYHDLRIVGVFDSENTIIEDPSEWGITGYEPLKLLYRGSNTVSPYKVLCIRIFDDSSTE